MSSNPDAMVALMKAVNKPTFGTLPDFGNFPKDGSRYAIDVYDAIARMMPYAKGVSAKSYDFDGSGRETSLDYARILKIVTDAGYQGFVGIEYEGERLSEPEGIKATKKLLESLRGSTYKPGAWRGRFQRDGRRDRRVARPRSSISRPPAASLRIASISPSQECAARRGQAAPVTFLNRRDILRIECR